MDLEKLGWTEGRQPQDRHSLGGTHRRGVGADRRGVSATICGGKLVALQPDLILSPVNFTTAALLQETRTIPIVLAIASDPVGSGFVASLAQPGGNVTGFMFSEASLGSDWLELRRSRAAC